MHLHGDVRAILKSVVRPEKAGDRQTGTIVSGAATRTPRRRAPDGIRRVPTFYRTSTTMNQTKPSRTFFITGVSSGFGRALAEAALAAGHRVVGTLRHEEQRAQFDALVIGLPWQHVGVERSIALV